jgi:Leucine-rich repeat (LRR) protein
LSNRKWTNLSIVLVLLFSLFSPFASLKTYAAAGLHLLDVTEKSESTVLVWEVVNDQEEELSNYQLIKNGEVLDIEPVLLNESTENQVKRYSYEDQKVEKNTFYKYEIAAYLSTGEKIVSAPLEHTFAGAVEDNQITLVENPEEEIVTTTIKVVTDQGTIPFAFDFFIEGAEVSYYGFLDEEGFFIDSESSSRDIELPIGTYTLNTYNYTTEEEISAEFTVESGKDYVTNPIEMVLPDEKLILKKIIKVEGKTDQSISINWDGYFDPEEIEKYRVYLNDQLVEEITDPFTTSYTYSGLLPATSYQVKVDYVYKDGTMESVSADVMTSPLPAGEEVVFADDNLKNAIKNQLKLYHRDIFTDDMENLTYLDASYSDINDLTGLELAVNLADLLLYGNQIKDLSPLANLTNLVSVDLDENLITSLEDLSQLKSLETLLVAFNQIEDISVLNELPNLTYVSLHGNEGLDFSKGSEDVEVLKNLITKGVTVEWQLESNEILIQEASETSIGIKFSFPGVTDFISTYNLYLNGDLVAEIPVDESSYVFTNLEPLTEYEISIDAVDEDGFIWGSAYTYVQTTPVPEGELVSFKDPALKEAVRDALHIYSRDLYESDMALLTSLDASARGIEELEGLELAVNLSELLLDSNDIRNLEPIAGLTNLVQLSMNKNNLTDISALGSLTNLELLMLDNNEINDISILSHIPNLMMVSLQGNKIKDISALAGMNIEFLNIGFNEIEDISSLLELENLQYVILMKNSLDLSEGSDDLSVIRTLEDKGILVMYEYLDISVDQVTENSIEISWSPVTQDGYEDFLYYIVVDGEEVALDLAASSYTLTDLQSNTEYSIEVVGISNDFERLIYGTVVVKTSAEEENPGDGSDEPGEDTGGEGEGETPAAPGTNPGNGTENSPTPENNAEKEPGILPNTGSNMYNILLSGVLLIVVGACHRYVSRKTY